jgi:hypothetical protein
MPAAQLSRKAVAFWGGTTVLIASAGLATVAVQQSLAATPASGSAPVSGTAGGNSGGGNNGVGGGNGAGTGVPAKALQVTGSADAVLAPGVTGAMTVQVTNPNTQDIVVTGLTARATSVTEPRRDPQLPACDPAWITFDPYVETVPALVVRAKRTEPVSLVVRFANLASNQDNCKSVRYSFDFTATARQAQR